MKIKMRSDLEKQNYKIPIANKENEYLNADEVSKLDFIYQCDLTGDTAVKNSEGELLILYSVDLDFVTKSNNYLTKEETKAAVTAIIAVRFKKYSV